MTVYVDAGRARRVLEEATEQARHKAYRVPRDMETKIEQILRHTHLTYKYILVNGLLAKATNPAANPIALQAGASLVGAFDARSLCHGVFVGFEQTVLEKRLGGSNEPFLNKPARFTHLSTDNAVRRGMDRLTLERLIAVFNQVNEQSNAKDALICALAHVLALESRVVSFDATRFGERVSKQALLRLAKRLLALSCEGESLALTVALLFEFLSQAEGGTLRVCSHPANQSGSSSNEISDIDVFPSDGGAPRYCCEAKDKPFNRADIDHAVGKVAQAGHSSMLFVYGPNARTAENLELVTREYEKKGFDLTFVAASAFIEGMVALAPTLAWSEVTQLLNKHLALTRAKEQTITHCRASLEAVASNPA